MLSFQDIWNIYQQTVSPDGEVVIFKKVLDRVIEFLD